MNSSSVYSIGDSIFKKATQFYNDYISNEKVQREKIVQDMLQEINHGEIIFSKNNVCIHLTEPYLANLTSNGTCNKNCLPGYFSIKLIKCQPEITEQQTKKNLPNSLIRKTNETKFEETSFTIREEFNLDELIKKNEDSINVLNKINLAKHSSKNDLKNGSSIQSKQSSSAYLKKQQEISSKKNSATAEQQNLTSYSMIVTWIPNLIFEGKQNKLTKNLSIKSTNSVSNQTFRRRSKSLTNLNNLNNFQNLDKSNENKLNYNLKIHRLTNNLVNYRFHASDTQLNLVSNNFNTDKSNEDLKDEDFIFSTDIKKIKSLKLFFGCQMKPAEDNDFNQTKDGQLVIGNFDLQYKIFHFHNGGLTRLERFLEDWSYVFYFNQKNSSNFLNFFENLFEEPNLFGDYNDSLLDFYRNKFIQLKNQHQLQKEYNNNEIRCIRLYTINLPALNYLDLQNEYSTYKPLAINNLEEYNQFFSPDGVLIYNFEKLKIRTFFSGCEKNSRKYFWPYLLKRFSANLTAKEKLEIKKHGEFLYKNINEKRRNIKKDDKFYRKFIQYQSTIKEDVPRTDRMNPALDKIKLKKMERILLNYTLYSRIGYTQGFSDLLAPLVINILNDEPESEIFFNFVYLIEKQNFFCLPNDDSIDSAIAKISELLRVLDVKFYNYFKELGEQSFLFTHRWVLLCFRREFDEDNALKIWEACFSEFQYQFQLFVCIAIIQIYGQDLIEKQLNSDDILFYFGNLSHKMNAELVMKKARSNLFQFRSLTKIPCTLRSLCNLKLKPNNPSNWTTQIQPFFECISSSENPNALLLCNCDKK